MAIRIDVEGPLTGSLQLGSTRSNPGTMRSTSSTAWVTPPRWNPGRNKIELCSRQWITASVTSTSADGLSLTGRPGRLSQLSVEKIVRQICHKGHTSSQGHFRLNP